MDSTTPQEPASATQTFSATTHPSLSRSIPVLEFLSQSWEDFGDNLDYETLAAPLQAGLDNLGKWYRRTDESDAYFITMGKYLHTELFVAHVANATTNSY